MRGQRLVQGRCNGEVVCQARTAAVYANGSINHHYSTEPPRETNAAIRPSIALWLEPFGPCYSLLPSLPSSPLLPSPSLAALSFHLPPSHPPSLPSALAPSLKL